MAARDDSKSIYMKISLWLANILAIVAIALAGWIGKQVHENSKIIASLQADHLTAREALDIWKEISNIKEEIAGIPRETPPSWFVTRLDKMEARMDQRMDTLEYKIEQIEHSQD